MYSINISIDDVSPHPRASVNVLRQCAKLINIFPDIKFSLFIPIAYWQTMPRPQMVTSTDKPLVISEFSDFCSILNSLPQKNFELCYHGYYHGIPSKSNNDEFQYLNYEQALEKFKLMFDVVDRAGLSDKFKKIFRPPAWRMSPGAIQAAITSGMEILALSPDQYALDVYQGEEKKFKNVIYYNVNPPFKKLSFFDKTEMVYHACEWDKNFLSEQKADELASFLQSADKEIKFCFLAGLLDGEN